MQVPRKSNQFHGLCPGRHQLVLQLWLIVPSEKFLIYSFLLPWHLLRILFLLLIGLEVDFVLLINLLHLFLRYFHRREL